MLVNIGSNRVLWRPKRKGGVPNFIGRDGEVLVREKDDWKTAPCYGYFKGKFS